MASISTDPNGTRRITYTDKATRKQKCIRLGNVTAKEAAVVRMHVEHLINHAATQSPLNTGTALWVATIGDDLAEKLARAGLITARPAALTVAGMLEAYGRTVVAKQKPSTRTVFGTITNDIAGYFKPGTELRSINAADAEEFKYHLQARGLASATVARRLTHARTLFGHAVKLNAIAANPFANVGSITELPKGKRVYVPAADILKVMQHADPTWRTILALARFGGLRCPTEVLLMRWEHVNLADGEMTVTSPKTEHHGGKAYRVMPIFGNLRPYLEVAWELAAPGEQFVVGGPRGDGYRAAANGPKGWVNSNLRTTLGKIIRRAGLKPWPKTFNTLRASCETDLLDAGLNPKAVTDWLGHSLSVAMLHYARIHDGHIKQAQAFGANEGVTKSVTTGSELGQTAPDTKGSRTAKVPESRVLSYVGRLGEGVGMGGEGLEPPTSSL